MSSQIIVLAGALLLVGCDQSEPENNAENLIAKIEPQSPDGTPQATFGFSEAMEPGTDLFGEGARTAREAVPSPDAVSGTANAGGSQIQPASDGQQIAYSYGFGFQIDQDAIATLQQRHVAMCEALKSACRVMRISQATSDGMDGYGELNLQVASNNAVAFGGSLAEPAKELGGELVSSVRDSEDLTVQIIDSEAKLASRLLLRDKLTAILRGNRGSVDELVKAEKAVAEVNEEIDSTRSTLKYLRNRVSYSAVRIEYEPYFGESQLGFGRPVTTAFRSIRTTLGITVAALIYLLTALIPITLFVLALRWVLHRFGMRIRFWRKNVATENTP